MKWWRRRPAPTPTWYLIALAGREDPRLGWTVAVDTISRTVKIRDPFGSLAVDWRMPDAVLDVR